MRSSPSSGARPGCPRAAGPSRQGWPSCTRARGFRHTHHQHSQQRTQAHTHTHAQQTHPEQQSSTLTQREHRIYHTSPCWPYPDAANSAAECPNCAGMSRKGAVLATKAVKAQGKGGVVAAKAVEAQCKGGVLAATKAVETHKGKGGDLATKAVEAHRAKAVSWPHLGEAGEVAHVACSKRTIRVCEGASYGRVRRGGLVLPANTPAKPVCGRHVGGAVLS